MKLLYGRAGFTVCSKFKFKRAGKETEGYIIAVLLNGRQMMSLPIEKVRRRVLDAILYAQNELKIDVVGLGSLITSVTDGGDWVIKQPGVKLAVTHGDTFTVAIARQGIEIILQKFNFDFVRDKVAVVGAYGLIGRELCVFLAQKGYRLILVESVPEKIELIKKRMAREGLSQYILAASTNVGSIIDADFVITATSHPSYLLKSADLKRNAVVYDIAQPVNLGQVVAEQRPDIVKIDGDYVDINDIDLKFLMGPPKGSTFACLIETAMLALEGDKKHHVGNIDKSFLETTKEWGKKYCFRHASFTSFGKPVRSILLSSDDKITKIR
ncbi:MAG: hypothetical protein WC310_05705 [Patescibacteria group bacterium]|jgi:predicted amino acid dehydrogenase